MEARRRKLAQGHSKIHSYIHSYIREHRGIVVSWDHGIDLLSHTNLTEETGVVLVDVGSVVVLTTGHTTTTWMLPVLADTTLTGRHVATAVGRREEWLAFHDIFQREEKRSKSSRSISQPASRPSLVIKAKAGSSLFGRIADRRIVHRDCVSCFGSRQGLPHPIDLS